MLAFSLTGTTIPAGCGILTVVELDGIPTGLSDIVIADASGNPLPFSYYDPNSIPGCMDSSACNYNADATEDDGSCTYADPNYDCDGNCTVTVDCAGACGGSAVDLGCGCGEAGPSGCDNACNSTAVVDDCEVCGGDGSTCLAPITVISPNGDEEWAFSTSQEITWSSNNITGKVKIELYSGSSYYQTLASSTSNDGSYNWSIPSNYSEGSYYKIKISSVSDDSIDDYGNSYFSLSSSSVSLQIQNIDTDPSGTGTLDIYISNSIAVGGFQFELTGITITSATAPSGFTVSISSNSVLGYSASSTTISSGSSVLTTVSFTNYSGGDICFDEDAGVISDVIFPNVYISFVLLSINRRTFS